jgi:hypothetical protein
MGADSSISRIAQVGTCSSRSDIQLSPWTNEPLPDLREILGSHDVTRLTRRFALDPVATPLRQHARLTYCLSRNTRRPRMSAEFAPAGKSTFKPNSRVISRGALMSRTLPNCATDETRYHSIVRLELTTLVITGTPIGLP